MIYSFSALKQFKTCPRQFAEIKVWKRIAPQKTLATDYGVRAHTAFEDFIVKGTPLPADMSGQQEFIDAIAALPGDKHCEVKYGLTRDMQPVDFFAPNVAIRGLADLTIRRPDVSVVVDYKSGKDKYPDLSQLELMALMEFALRPEIDVIRGALLFFIAGTSRNGEWRREQIPTLWAGWLAAMDRADRAIEANVFQEKSSGLCRGWCPVHTCDHYEEKK